MKTTKLVWVGLLCLFAVAMYAADNPMMGTWTKDSAKSKIAAGGAMNNTVVYSPDGDNIKVTTDGTDAKGQPTHTDWVGKFDGKEYPVTGAAAGTTRAYKQINDRTLELTNMVNGKVTMHGKIEVSKDGKTRTVDVEETMPDGKKAKSKGVYDKQ
jgi:hypothetical protein